MKTPFYKFVVLLKLEGPFWGEERVEVYAYTPQHAMRITKRHGYVAVSATRE